MQRTWMILPHLQTVRHVLPVRGGGEAFEIGFGANQIDAAVVALLKMKAAIEAEPRAKAPSILVVVCGLTSFAYTRPDGVMVVPIAALRE